MITKPLIARDPARNARRRRRWVRRSVQQRAGQRRRGWLGWLRRHRGLGWCDRCGWCRRRCGTPLRRCWRLVERRQLVGRLAPVVRRARVRPVKPGQAERPIGRVGGQGGRGAAGAAGGRGGKAGGSGDAGGRAAVPRGLVPHRSRRGPARRARALTRSPSKPTPAPASAKGRSSGRRPGWGREVPISSGARRLLEERAVERSGHGRDRLARVLRDRRRHAERHGQPHPGPVDAQGDGRAAGGVHRLGDCGERQALQRLLPEPGADQDLGQRVLLRRVDVAGHGLDPRVVTWGVNSSGMAGADQATTT